MDSRDLSVGSARVVLKNRRMDSQLTVNVTHRAIPSAFTDVYVRARTSHSMQIRLDSSLNAKNILRGRSEQEKGDLLRSPFSLFAEFVESVI